LLAELTAPEGKILLGASSTAITRVAEKLPSIAHLRILGRSKFRGFSALLLERQFPGKRPGVERSRAVNPPIDNRSA
jgi:hypothetical protein